MVAIKGGKRMLLLRYSLQSIGDDVMGFEQDGLELETVFCFWTFRQ